MVQTYTLRIKNGTRHVKQYRIWLWWKKYTCIKRANGRVYYEKKNVPGGKKIICSVLAEEKDSLLKPCRRNIREVTVTAVSFLPVILPQLGNTDVHTVAKKAKR